MALSVSGLVHLGLASVAMLLAQRPLVVSWPSHSVEIVVAKPAVAQDAVLEAPRIPREVGRLGHPQGKEATLSSLAPARDRGTAIGEQRAQPHTDLVAGDDTASLNTRIHSHRRLDVQRSVQRPSRHVATPRHVRSREEEPTPFIDPGAAASRSDHPAQRPGKPGVAYLNRSQRGQQAAEPAAPQHKNADQLSRIPLEGALPEPPARQQQPAEVSSRRLTDLMDAARPHDRGRDGGRGHGSLAGRRGSQAGGDSRRVVWLSTPDDRYVGYFRKIYRKVQPLWGFPKDLEVLLEQGDVLIQFTILADGAVRNVRVRKSSGYRKFDSNVVAAIRKAAPFDPIPRHLGQQLNVLAPFEFSNPMVR